MRAEHTGQHWRIRAHTAHSWQRTAAGTQLALVHTARSGAQSARAGTRWRAASALSRGVCAAAQVSRDAQLLREGHQQGARPRLGQPTDGTTAGARRATAPQDAAHPVQAHRACRHILQAHLAGSSCRAGPPSEGRAWTAATLSSPLLASPSPSSPLLASPRLSSPLLAPLVPLALTGVLRDDAQGAAGGEERPALVQD